MQFGSELLRGSEGGLSLGNYSCSQLGLFCFDRSKEYM